MRLDVMKNKLPVIVAIAALVVALAAPGARAASGEPPMASAVNAAIMSIAPETYPDYVWTFIRRGESVKIKGKGPDRIIAMFGLSSGEGDEPILTLTSFKQIGANGTTERICDENGRCRVINRGYDVSEAASQNGQSASASKSGNGNGKGKGGK